MATPGGLVKKVGNALGRLSAGSSRHVVNSDHDHDQRRSNGVFQPEPESFGKACGGCKAIRYICWDWRMAFRASTFANCMKIPKARYGLAPSEAGWTRCVAANSIASLKRTDC